MHRVRMLIHFGITPYLVFDGDNLPSKASVEGARAQGREEHKKKGLELYNSRKKGLAYSEFQKAVDITPRMARQLIDELKKMNVRYVVAPYEADAQLAFLEKKGIIDAILSEDSDLLVYGAKKLITKLDQYGDCVEIRRSDFAACRDMSLAGFTDHDFRHMAILSGCDYLSSISKMGLKTAHSYVRKYKTVEKVIRMLEFENKFDVPPGYLDRFYRAERTFLHHRVFCPIEKRLVHLTELEHDLQGKDMPYLGAALTPDVAIGVACGELDPTTKRPISLATNQVNPVRSMPSLTRHTTAVSANDLKTSQSIESFFKPKRQPLAELDPNTLTPSPSQRRLLEVHRNTSWEARPISSAPQPRRTTPTPSRTQAAERTAFLERAATLSTFQPSKRTRLCSDIADDQPTTKVDRSRFFALRPEASPSTRKTGHTKKARSSDIEIYSDDSVGDVFHEIQLSEQLTAPLQQDPCKTLGQGLGASTNDPGAAVTAVCDTPLRRDRSRRLSPEQRSPSERSSTHKEPKNSTAQTQEGTDDFEDLFALHTSKIQSQYLHTTFGYQPPESQAAALSTLDTVAPILEKNQQSVVADSKDDNLQNGSNNPNAALTISDLPPSHAISKTFSEQSSARQQSALKSLGPAQTPAEKIKLGVAALDSGQDLRTNAGIQVPLEEKGCRACEQAVTPPDDIDSKISISYPVLDTMVATEGYGATPALPDLDAMASGSRSDVRDIVVPNSDNDVAEYPEVEQKETYQPKLDLDRFVYAA